MATSSATAASTRRSAGGDARAIGGRVGHATLVGVRRIFPVESPNSLLLLGTTLFLVVFGLVMVLSSSSVESWRSTGDFFNSFVKQAAFAVVGIPLMLVAARMPKAFWKRIAWWGVLLGIGLQALVFTPLGIAVNGNRNWLAIGSFSLQPSEFVKLALCVWLGLIMTVKQPLLDRFWHAWLPVAPVAGLSIGLVLLGDDLGTVSIMVMLSLGALWFAGVKWWHIVLPLAVMAVVAVPLVMSSASRIRRIGTFFQGCTEADYFDTCWQQFHGLWALASGGIFGVGLGNSRAKWSWLSEADNDYIFAIVGEELGLVGATVVLLLFVVLAYAMLRIIRSTTDQFTRVVTGGVMVWIVGQALVNVAVVLGLLPVLGVPLPLISAGGSQIIASMLAVGVVLSLSRADSLERAARDSTRRRRAEDTGRR